MLKTVFSAILFLLINQTAFAIDPFYSGTNGIREQVLKPKCLSCHSSDLTGSLREGAPSSVNYDSYDSALNHADRAIVLGIDLMTMPPAFSDITPLNEEQKAAMLAWQQAGFPNEPETQQADNATYDNVSATLSLPVVHVGNQTFQATLTFFPLPGSAQGFGLELKNANLTDQTSTTAATFDSLNGIVEMPEIEILNIPEDVGLNKVQAQMVLIPNTNPLRFEVTTINFLGSLR